MSAGVDQAEPKSRTEKKSLDLLDDPDQNRVHSELSTFFGPRADTYLDTYEKMRSAAGSRRRTPFTWCWSVFFGSFVWFFYRKMYAFGAILILLPVIGSYLFGSGGAFLIVVFAASAKGWYVNVGLERIAKADRLGLTGVERSDYLQQAGGVSVPAGIFAGFLYACFLTLVIFAFVAGRNIGQ